ncbi:hypothetical protein SUGI_0908580 [Cryptomeria japonica]|nr:hypothetical protein SUGI_0908580 [Cryptomeria japonica]
MVMVGDSVHAGLSVFFLVLHFSSRAEEEAEQPRANSSYRHEMQNPASVHITDAKRKKSEVPYDRLCNELIFSYTANQFGFAMKRRSHGEVSRYEIVEDLDVLSREATMCSSAYIAPATSKLGCLIFLSQSHAEGSHHVL